MPSLQQTRRKTLTRQPRPQSGTPTICGYLEMLINLVADTDHMWITPNVRMSRSHADAWSRSRMDNSKTYHALSTYVVLCYARRVGLGINQVPPSPPRRASATRDVSVISTATPASAAIRAAENLVSAPPVPTPASPILPNSIPASRSP